MKKMMSIMLGLALFVGATSAVFGQATDTTTKSTKAKKSKKKKTDTTATK